MRKRTIVAFTPIVGKALTKSLKAGKADKGISSGTTQKRVTSGNPYVELDVKHVIQSSIGMSVRFFTYNVDVNEAFVFYEEVKLTKVKRAEELLLFSEQFALSVKKAISDTFVYQETVSLRTIKTFVESLVFGEEFGFSRGFSSYEGLQFTEVLVKKMKKIVVRSPGSSLRNERYRFIETFKKTITRYLTETILFTETMTYFTNEPSTIIKTFTENLQFGEAFELYRLKQSSEAMSFGETMALRLTKVSEEAMVFLEEFFFRRIIPAVNESLLFSEQFLIYPRKAFNEAFLFAETFALRSNKVASEAFLFMETLTLQLGQRLTFAEDFHWLETLVNKTKKTTSEALLFLEEFTLSLIAPTTGSYWDDDYTEFVHTVNGLFKELYNFSETLILQFSKSSTENFVFTEEFSVTLTSGFDYVDDATYTSDTDYGF